MANLSFNIRTEYIEETKKVIEGLLSIKFRYSPLIRNDTESHVLVEGGIEDISKLTEYLRKKNAS